MQKDRLVITVDGFSACGKSTIARELAARIGFQHLNSGLLYRGLGLISVKNCVNPDDEPELVKLLSDHSFKLTVGPTLLIDGLDVTGELSSPQISDAASRLSVHPKVRALFLQAQREAFSGNGIVAEGRDMGTVVFPDADLKFFIEADSRVRAERRALQLNGLSADELEREIVSRDKRDLERGISPTVKAEDAIVIDNNHNSLTQVIEIMYACVLSRGLALGL